VLASAAGTNVLLGEAAKTSVSFGAGDNFAVADLLENIAWESL
jgi:hypothetical protein